MLYHGGINLRRLLKIWLIYDEAYLATSRYSYKLKIFFEGILHLYLLVVVVTRTMVSLSY